MIGIARVDFLNNPGAWMPQETCVYILVNFRLLSFQEAEEESGAKQYKFHQNAHKIMQRPPRLI